MDMNELKLMQNYPLSIKISKTQFRIREFYEYFNGEVYVAFSGGNDSLVMLHIIRSMYPDVKAVFVDTGVEFPEVRKFVKTFDNVIFLKPQKNFSQIITDYGYPIISKDVSNSIRLARKNIIEGKDTYRVRQFDGSQKGSRFDKSKWKFLLDAPFKISEQCCDELKKKPFKKFEKETGLKGYIGVLASEGGVRLQGYLKTGCNNYRFGNSKPLGFWTHQDILQYIKIYNLNMCPVYGDLIFDVDEAQALHNNAVKMLQNALGIDVLTTFAEVDVADMADKNTTTTTDELMKVERTVYNEAGVSQMQFNTNGNIALEKSILNDAANMYNLLLQFESFMNDLLSPFNKTPKKIFYRVQILTTTIYNYQEMAKLYKEQTQLGYSKMLPQIALGQSQSSILANAYFENDILDLVHVFIPPMSSNTMNAEAIANRSGKSSSDGDGNVGRNEKPNDEKSEKTIQNRESMN